MNMTINSHNHIIQPTYDTFLYLKDTKQNGPVYEISVSHRREARTHADLRICADSQKPCLLAYTVYDIDADAGQTLNF